MISSKALTYILLVSAMFLWGGTWVSGRLLAGEMDPLSASFLRFAAGSIYLVIATIVTTGKFPRLPLKFVPHCFGLGAVGVFGYSMFFFSGLQTSSAGRAALIVACIPVCIAALSSVIFKERFGPIRIFGTLLSLSGVSVVLSGGNPLHLLDGGVARGDLFILGCVASWTAYSLGGKLVMKHMSAFTAVTWSCIFGTLLMLPMAVYNDIGTVIMNSHWGDWANIGYLGVLATGLSYSWYYSAIQELGAAKAGIFINMVPVFAIMLAAVILGEPVGLSLVIGGCMVIGGVWLTNRFN